jgi:hypothetical protein
MSRDHERSADYPDSVSVARPGPARWRSSGWLWVVAIIFLTLLVILLISWSLEDNTATNSGAEVTMQSLVAPSVARQLV